MDSLRSLLTAMLTSEQREFNYYLLALGVGGLLLLTFALLLRAPRLHREGALTARTLTLVQGLGFFLLPFYLGIAYVGGFHLAQSYHLFPL